MRRKMTRVMTSLMLCLVMLLMQMVNIPGIGSMILVAEAASEEVLYEQNFDSYTLKDGANDNGWYLYKTDNSATTVTIKDGAMHINGSTKASGYDIVYLNNGAQWSNYTIEADLKYTKSTGWFGLAFNVTDGTAYQKGGLTIANRWSINGRYNGKWVNDNKGDYTTGIEVNDTIRMKIISNGSDASISYAFYDDQGNLGTYTDVKSVSNIDANTQSGSIGLMLGSGSNSTNVVLDNVVVTSNADNSVLYSEDFSITYAMTGSSAGTANDFGFTYLSNKGKSTAVVKDGSLYLTNVESGDTYPRVWVTDGDYSDYTVEADITYLTASNWVGLVFDLADGNNFFNGKVTQAKKISINGYSNGFSESKYDQTGVNKGFTCAGTTGLENVTIDVNVPVRHRIVTKDNVATLYIAFYDNGVLGEYKKALTIENIPESMYSGSVGFVLASNATSVMVDNLKVTANPTHECASASEWSYDASNHWHACTNTECDEVFDKTVHSYDDDTDTTCECGYVRTIVNDDEIEIIYQENFDSYTGKTELTPGINYAADGGAGAGWIWKKNSSGGYAYIEDGKLYFAGSAYDVLYRDGGQTWGNYTVEADMSYNTDNAGWAGLLYNVQNEGKYQKGGLSYSSGKISLNGRDTAVKSGWTNDDSQNKAAYSNYGISVTQDTDFRLKIKVNNNVATIWYAQYTDGVLGDWIETITIDNIREDAQTGSIGFMTSNGGLGSIVVDNITVYSNSEISYTENFDSLTAGSLTADTVNDSTGLFYERITTDGTAEIKDGKLWLYGGACDNVIFNTGKNWTNYTVEADFCYPVAPGGWTGLLYRSTDYQNFQKAMVTTNDRSNLNGKLDGSWYNDSDPVTKRDYDGNVVIGEPFRLKVVAHENSAELYIAYYTNGVLGDWNYVMKVEDTFASDHMTGTIGVLVGGSSNSKRNTVWIDNVVVSRGTDRMSEKPPKVAGIADIYEPDTGIVNPPTPIQKVTTELPVVTGKTPAVALMEIDADLNILSESGSIIGTVDEFQNSQADVIIPAYIIDSQAEATALADYMTAEGIIDAFVVADDSNAALVKSFRDVCVNIRGALMFDDLSTDANRQAARALVNDNKCYVAISAKPLDGEAIEYFDVRQIATWAPAEDEGDVYTAIANGWSGIMATDPALIYDVYESITATTVSGQPIIIAHRGAHLDTNENTITGFKEAMNAYGCQAVETDIRITTDGVVFLMHDGTVDRTTNGSGNNLQMTWEELDALIVDEKGEAYGNYDEVPRWDEVLEEFKDSDLVFYCHINAKTDANVKAFSELVEQYDFEDNVLFFISYVNRVDYDSDSELIADGITFTAGDYPSLHTSSATDLEAVKNFITGLVPYNYQPLFYSYSTYPTESFYYQMSARGFINSHSITNGQAKLDNTLLTGMGAVGLLTDQPNNTDDYAYAIEVSDETIRFDEEIDMTHDIIRIVGKTENVTCGAIQLSGSALVETENGYTVADTNPVELVFYADVTGGASSYRLYSEPVTITVEPIIVPVTGVSLDLSETTLTVGDTETLTATIAPEDATNKNVTWSSSDESVATVDGGVVTAVSAGTATITVTTEDGEYEDSCTVTVKKSSSTKRKYPVVNVETETDNGTIEANVSKATRGSTVVITAAPQEGFELDELVIIDKNGNRIEVTPIGNDMYSFVMPVGEVIIEAEFVEKITEVPFVDVKKDDYFYDAVSWAVENDVTKGTSETNFSSNDSCTRAQTMTFLWNAAGRPEPTTTECPFDDVDPASYYYKAVLWAVEEGITSGTSATTFGSDQTVTRGQNVTFLWKFADKPAMEDGSKFADVSDAKYYHDAVVWAAEEGITSGTSATTFGPENPCTRAQIVTFLYRYMTK